MNQSLIIHLTSRAIFFLKRRQCVNRSDTVEHVLDAVHRTFSFVELFELFAQVEEPTEVRRKRDILARRLGQQTHPEVQLAVGTEREWTTAVIWVYRFRT